MPFPFQKLYFIRVYSIWPMFLLLTIVGEEDGKLVASEAHFAWWWPFNWPLRLLQWSVNGKILLSGPQG